MPTSRLEAFSDGVIAIIITIMVLELKIPHGTEFSSLGPLLPMFVTYVMSFIYLGIYWNNHHHMMHVVESVNGGVLWANMHLLFWLSLVPFVTGWMGENHFAELPTAVYGGVLLMAAIAYKILVVAILAHNGRDSRLGRALGTDLKGNISIVLYVSAIPLAFVHQWIADAIYITVAVMWLIPDRRIESRLREES